MTSNGNAGSLPEYDSRKYEQTVVVPPRTNLRVDHILTDASKVTMVLQTAGVHQVKASRNEAGDPDGLDLMAGVFVSPSKYDLHGNSDYLVITNGSDVEVEVKVIVVG